MSRLAVFSMLLCSCLPALANGNLINDIYSHAILRGGENMSTGFVALSKMNLDEAVLDKVKENYTAEKEPERQYNYVYLLSKKTQEEEYITAFISKSSDNIPALLENKTKWDSVESPFYKHLANYALTNELALKLLFKLGGMAEGEMSSIVAKDLASIQKANVDYFNKTAKLLELSESDIKKLLEKSS